LSLRGQSAISGSATVGPLLEATRAPCRSCSRTFQIPSVPGLSIAWRGRAATPRGLSISEGLRHLLARHTLDWVATDGLDGADPFHADPPMRPGEPPLIRRRRSSAGCSRRWPRPPPARPRLSPGECFSNLLRNPFCRRMRRHIEPDKLSSGQPHNDQDIQQIEADGRNHEQIHGRDTQEGARPCISRDSRTVQSR
jgi:hypothetical protein